MKLATSSAAAGTSVISSSTASEGRARAGKHAAARPAEAGAKRLEAIAAAPPGLTPARLVGVGLACACWKALLGRLSFPLAISSIACWPAGRPADRPRPCGTSCGPTSRPTRSRRARASRGRFAVDDLLLAELGRIDGRAARRRARSPRSPAPARGLLAQCPLDEGPRGSLFFEPVGMPRPCGGAQAARPCGPAVTAEARTVFTVLLVAASPSCAGAAWPASVKFPLAGLSACVAGRAGRSRRRRGQDSLSEVGVVLAGRDRLGRVERGGQGRRAPCGYRVAAEGVQVEARRSSRSGCRPRSLATRSRCG